MRVKLTNEQFDSNPYWTERVKSRFETPSIRWLELFDQNGYDLCKLEQLFAMANGVELLDHRDDRHVVIRKDWFTDDKPETGAHINHAVMFERKGYKGDALKQLETWAHGNNHIYKVIQMKPKWGLDFSIDYVDKDKNVFEVLHWEWDSFSYEEIQAKKDNMDKFLVSIDWQESALEILNRKDEWHHLGFFEQSEWKTNFFGIEKEQFKIVLWD